MVSIVLDWNVLVGFIKTRGGLFLCVCVCVQDFCEPLKDPSFSQTAEAIHRDAELHQCPLRTSSFCLRFPAFHFATTPPEKNTEHGPAIWQHSDSESVRFVPTHLPSALCLFFFNVKAFLRQQSADSFRMPLISDCQTPLSAADLFFFF